MSQTDTPAEGSTPDAPVAETTEVKETKTFDADYVKTLRSENARYRTEAQEVKKRLEELETRDASELEKAQRKATKAEQEAAQAASKLTRYEVAAEKGLPADTLDLLSGNTREELEAKADRILELVKNRTDTDTRPDFDGGARESAPEPKSPEEAHNALAAALFGNKT